MSISRANFVNKESFFGNSDYNIENMVGIKDSATNCFHLENCTTSSSSVVNFWDSEQERRFKYEGGKLQAHDGVD